MLRYPNESDHTKRNQGILDRGSLKVVLKELLTLNGNVLPRHLDLGNPVD